MENKAIITGLGAYLPEKVLTNRDLERMVDTSDEWITTRTGMKERRIAADHEFTSDMGFAAAKQALQAAELKPDSIDLILCATLTPDHLFPSTACLIQARLQAENAAAVDIQAACTGFIYALSMAKAYIESGIYRKILIVSPEKLSSIVDYQDRSTCVLFGDGAAACVVEANRTKGLIIDHVNLGSDGTKADLMVLPAGGAKMPASEETVRNRAHYLQMEGRETYKNAVRRMESSIKDCMGAMNIEEEAIGWLIPHQANMRIIGSLAKRFRVPEDRVFLTIHKYGNTSASSVGIALNELIRGETVADQEKVMLVAFGAGLTFGSALLTYRGKSMKKDDLARTSEQNLRNLGTFVSSSTSRDSLEISKKQAVQSSPQSDEKGGLALLFPGQGAQYVGMGRDFFSAFPIARETFEEADDLLSYRLSQLIFEGPETELTATKNSQIAIYVTSIAIWRVVQQQFPDLVPTVCSGLSLGEYTAMTVAGSLAWDAGIHLVRSRGLLMEEASLAHPGTMAVALGTTVAAVEAALKESTEKEVWLANVNCPGQVVISGTKAGVMRMSEELCRRGVKRMIPLAVSGAFHSGLMASAGEKLTPILAEVTLQQGSAAIVMNVPGDYVTEIEDRRRFLAKQVVAPVYWEKGVAAMKSRDTKMFIEIGCGKTLSGMNRKMGLGPATFHVEKVEDLENLARAWEERNATANCM